MAKRGRKPKIGPEEEKQVYAMLETGCSLNDAADVLGVGRQTIRDHKRLCENFRTGVDRAAANGKKRLIAKIGKAKPWQAAAFMLERKYGAEWGRREAIHHTGNVKASGKVTIEHQFDYEQYKNDFADFNRSSVRGERHEVASGNGN